MRTEITIDGRPLKALERRAASTGASVNRLVEDAVRLLLAERSLAAELPGSFEVVTFGAGGRFPGRRLNASELLAAADEELHRGETRR